MTPDPITNEAREAAEPELRRWQDAIRGLCLDLAPDGTNIDGGGCDSGDPLGLTLTEVRQMGNALNDLIATQATRIAELESLLRESQTSIGGDWRDRRDAALAFPSSPSAVPDDREASLRAFIADVESRYFRTNQDTGANLNALFVWNQVRKHAGLEQLQLEDLPAYCTVHKCYHKIGADCRRHQEAKQ